MEINPVIFRFFNGEYFALLIMEIYLLDGYYTEKIVTIDNQIVDLIITKGSEKIIFRCKRYNANVGKKAVQEAFASMKSYKNNYAFSESNTIFTYGIKKNFKDLKLDVVSCKIPSKNLSSNDNYTCNHFFKSGQLTQMLVNAGFELLKRSLYKEAIELLIDIINSKEHFLSKNRIDLINAHNYLALCYSRSRDFTNAEKVCLEGLKIGSNSDLLFNLTILYRSERRYLEAKYTLEKILELTDGNDLLHQMVIKQMTTINEFIQLETQMMQGVISKEIYFKKVQAVPNTSWISQSINFILNGI